MMKRTAPTVKIELMPLNHKLANAIQGRKVYSVMQPLADRGRSFLVLFDDGSRMGIKVSELPPCIPLHLQSPIVRVRQNEVTISFDFENGESLAFSLAEATSSVLLRDRNGGFEYAD